MTRDLKAALVFCAVPYSLSPLESLTFPQLGHSAPFVSVLGSMASVVTMILFAIRTGRHILADQAREPATWARPADGHRWGWPPLAAGLLACMEHGLTNIRRVEEAHGRLRRSKGVADETVKDSAFARENILGEATWQGDLPFFMQGNFDDGRWGMTSPRRAGTRARA